MSLVNKKIYHLTNDEGVGKFICQRDFAIDLQEGENWKLTYKARVLIINEFNILIRKEFKKLELEAAVVGDGPLIGGMAGLGTSLGIMGGLAAAILAPVTAGTSVAFYASMAVGATIVGGTTATAISVGRIDQYYKRLEIANSIFANYLAEHKNPVAEEALKYVLNDMKEKKLLAGLSGFLPKKT